jgi:hypothetical protein
VVAGGALASLAGAASADSLAIVVAPSLAPNAYGSPSFAEYQSNALHALENGLTSYGDPAAPTAYQRITGAVPVANAIVTGFGSWMGNAGVSGAYVNEYGNRVTFGVDISGSSKFSISQLSFSAVSSDPANSLGFSYAAGSYSYSGAYVGIDYGANGVKGGGDDIYITRGPGDQLVNEIVGRGSGNSWAVYPADAGATNQEKIDNAADDIWTDALSQPFTFTATYSIGGASGSATVVFDNTKTPSDTTVTPLPAAASAGTFLLAMLGLTARRRRRLGV